MAWEHRLSRAGFGVDSEADIRALVPDEVAHEAYDLVLVDQRAIDDRDVKDISGQTFAEQLSNHGAPTAILTAYPVPQDPIFDLLRHTRVLGIIRKTLGAWETVSLIENFFATGLFPNGVAQFELLDGSDQGKASRLWRVLSEHLRSLGVQATIEELSALFRTLISPCASRVGLGTPRAGRGGAAVARAWVFSGDSAIHEELALKFGDRSTVESEAIRYDKHVGPLPDGVAAQLRWRAVTENLGGIAYSWVGDSVDDAQPFGPTLTANHFMWRCRRRAIQSLFSTGLDRWYTVYRRGSQIPGEAPSITEYYTSRGGLWYNELSSLQSIELPPVVLPSGYAINKAGDQWVFETLSSQLVDPLVWLKLFGRNLKLGKLCPCHGDLHVGNVFLLPDESPRLIDFGRTAGGHIWRDFTALEASVRLTCVGDMQPEALRVAEDTVAAAPSLTVRLDHTRVAGRTDLAEAIRTTTTIRREAAHAAGGTVSRDLFLEYIASLVLQFVKYAAEVQTRFPMIMTL